MFTYRLHSPDGDDLGEATYAMMIKARRGDHRRPQPAVPGVDVVPRHYPSVELLTEANYEWDPWPCRALRQSSAAPPAVRRLEPQRESVWLSKGGRSEHQSSRATREDGPDQSRDL